METRKSDTWQETRHELKRFVYRKVKDRDLAEDIVQDVFVKALTRLHQLQDEDKVKGWMYRIAQNEIIDHFRRQTKTIEVSEVEFESEPAPLKDCVSHCLGEMVLTLPEKYRDAMLAEVEGLPQKDLAQKLNISYSGAKSRIQRARTMLKEMMVEKYNIKMDRYGNVLVCEDRVPCDCAAESR